MSVVCSWLKESLHDPSVWKEVSRIESTSGDYNHGKYHNGYPCMYTHAHFYTHGHNHRHTHKLICFVPSIYQEYVRDIRERENHAITSTKSTATAAVHRSFRAPLTRPLACLSSWPDRQQTHRPGGSWGKACPAPVKDLNKFHYWTAPCWSL